MSRSPRRRTVIGALAALTVVLPVSMAWACVAPVSLTTEKSTVQPGGTIKVIGRETAPGAPIEIRLDAVDGRLLTTVTGQPGGMSAKWEADVVIPPEVPYGKHTLFAIQNYRNMNAVVPRATIYVGVEPDPLPTPEERPASLDVGSGPSTGTLVMLGLVAAVGGLLLVGGLTALFNTSRSKPQAERVKAS